MSTPICRSPELEHFDWFLFSLLFSRALVYHYFDVCVCFVFFYGAFYILHATRDETCL